MKNLFLVDLEYIESRYTAEWKTGLPELLNKEAKNRDIPLKVNIIEGEDIDYIHTPNYKLSTNNTSFLNFTDTNIYKSNQSIYISQLFKNNIVQPGDQFLFTDAWNPTITQVKYMSDLLDIPVIMHGIWHAGSYDPQDFLGRKVKDKQWSMNFERSLFHALDYSYFATHFHMAMFLNALFPIEQVNKSKLNICGQPHNLLLNKLTMEHIQNKVKEDIILFPHRLAPEKQLDIFKDLEKHLPKYKFMVCQEHGLTKDEYHNLLSKSKLIFSASLQETLGIAMMEGIITNNIVMVPDRLSYAEMYDEEFKYPSEYTIDFDSYEKNKTFLIKKIIDYMENFDKYKINVQLQKEKLIQKYLYPNLMLNNIFKHAK